MYCILAVGMTGQGKSQFVKSYIKGRKCFVFDVQNEYLDLSLNPMADRARDCSMNEKKFIEACNKKKNTVCVFEEATGFFEGKTSAEMRRLILSKRHTGNVIILCFHSISAIPPRIVQFTNFVVLYKTNDEDYQVLNKYPSLYSHFMEVKKLPNHNSKTIKLIEQ